MVWRLLTLRTYLSLQVLCIIFRNSDFTIPRFRTVAYGKHSLTYLGPVIWSKSTDLFDRLNRSTFLKSALDWLISQACWTLLVKTAFYVTSNN